jgi:hypothetical protein
MQRQRESAFREHERRERAIDRDAEKQGREEARYNAGRQREDEKRVKDLSRRMESREREEHRLQRTQARYSQTRGNRFDRISYQASDQLTPSKFRSLQRQIDIYRREYPQHAAEIMGIESGAGSAEGAIRVAHAGRLGHMGQRAASLRDRRSLRMAERDLQIMEKDVLAALKKGAEGSPEHADALRLQQAIGEARKRIVVGKGLPASAANRSGVGRAAAGHFGRFGGQIAEKGLQLLFEGGPIAKVIGGALVAESLPFVNSAVQTMLQGLSQPYMNLRSSTARAGRAAGFSSRDLEAQFFTGATPPDWMKNLGLTPQHAADIYNKSGVIARSPREAAAVVE